MLPSILYNYYELNFVYHYCVGQIILSQVVIAVPMPKKLFDPKKVLILKATTTCTKKGLPRETILSLVTYTPIDTTSYSTFDLYSLLFIGLRTSEDSSGSDDDNDDDDETDSSSESDL